MGKATVKMPGHEKPLSLGILVRQPATEFSHTR